MANNKALPAIYKSIKLYGVKEKRLNLVYITGGCIGSLLPKESECHFRTSVYIHAVSWYTLLTFEGILVCIRQ